MAAIQRLLKKHALLRLKRAWSRGRWHPSEKIVKEVTHQAYFVLVALESENLYRWAAFVLFGVGVSSYLIHHFSDSKAIPTSGEKSASSVEEELEEDKP